MSDLQAPFPWFGGKRRAAHIVWPRFGDTLNYVEPFAGSLAMLLERPFTVRTETVNDADCYLANFWRAVAQDAEAVAHYADWPVNECDLSARHLWLVNQAEFRERMKTDPDYCDAKIAGWWVWGLSAWIGSGWCDLSRSEGVRRQLPHVGDSGQGVNSNRVRRQLPHVGDSGRGVNSNRVRRQLPRVGGGGNGVNAQRSNDIYAYMEALSTRLRRVRVCCGDWTRVMGASVTVKIGTTAVFLDPPYNADADRADLYAVEDKQVSTAVREWALANGDNPKLRIALCGYEREHGQYMPDNWECVAWKAKGGYGGQRKDGDNDNGTQERIWFSPHCLSVTAASGIVDTNDYSDLFK